MFLDEDEDEADFSETRGSFSGVGQMGSEPEVDSDDDHNDQSSSSAWDEKMFAHTGLEIPHLQQQILNRNFDSDNSMDPTAERVERWRQTPKGSTQRKLAQIVPKFREWLSQHEQREIKDMPIEVLDHYVALWLVDMKKPDGSEYEPTSIQSHFTTIKKYIASILQVDVSEDFPTSTRILRSKKKDLRIKGFGSQPNKADIITPQDEEKLWATGALGTRNRRTLLHTLWYLLIKHFGLRGYQAFQMKWGDVTLVEDSGDEYLMFHERERESPSGVTRPPSGKFFPPILANKAFPDRCPINIFKKYRDHRPPNCSDAFWLVINHNETGRRWYMDAPMGQNRFAQIMAKIAEDGGLVGRYTNHSVRRTVSTFLEQGSWVFHPATLPTN